MSVVFSYLQFRKILPIYYLVTVMLIYLSGTGVKAKQTAHLLSFILSMTNWNENPSLIFSGKSQTLSRVNTLLY